MSQNINIPFNVRVDITLTEQAVFYMSVFEAIGASNTKNEVAATRRELEVCGSFLREIIKLSSSSPGAFGTRLTQVLDVLPPSQSVMLLSLYVAMC
jgi:hypothetical protein